jgi:hypothetical protein
MGEAVKNTLYWTNRIALAAYPFIPRNTEEFQSNTESGTLKLNTLSLADPLAGSLLVTGLTTEDTHKRPFYAALDAGLLGSYWIHQSFLLPSTTTKETTDSTQEEHDAGCGSPEECLSERYAEPGPDPTPDVPVAQLAPEVIQREVDVFRNAGRTTAKYGLLRIADQSFFPKNVWARRGTIVALGSSVFLAEALAGNQEQNFSTSVIGTTEALLYPERPWLVGVGNLTLWQSVIMPPKEAQVDVDMLNPSQEPDATMKQAHSTAHTIGYASFGGLGAVTGASVIYPRGDWNWGDEGLMLLLPTAALATDWSYAVYLSNHGDKNQTKHAALDTAAFVAGAGVGVGLNALILAHRNGTKDDSGQLQLKGHNLQWSFEPSVEGVSIGLSGRW